MQFLGSSRMTSIMGYLVIVLTVAQQAFIQQGFPKNSNEWITLLGGIVTGVGLRLAKDHDVSNAPVPSNEAKPVQ